MNLESSHENTVDERPLPDHEDKKDTQATNIKDSNDNPTITITDEDSTPRFQSKNSMGHSRTNMPLVNSQFQYIRKEEVPYFLGHNIHYTQNVQTTFFSINLPTQPTSGTGWYLKKNIFEIDSPREKFPRRQFKCSITSIGKRIFHILSLI